MGDSPHTTSRKKISYNDVLHISTPHHSPFLEGRKEGRKVILDTESIKPKPRVADGLISGWDLDAPFLRVCQNSGLEDWLKSVAARGPH